MNERFNSQWPSWHVIYLFERFFEWLKLLWNSTSYIYIYIYIYYIYIYIYIYIYKMSCWHNQSIGRMKNVVWSYSSSLQRLPQTSVLDMTQKIWWTPVMLELWGMLSIPSLQSLPDPFWPVVIAPDRILSIGQI